MNDLFADLPPEAGGYGNAPPSAQRPTAADFESTWLMRRVCDLLSVASRNDIPAGALPVVVKQLAERECLAMTEIEVAAMSHRNWERVCKRPVPSLAAAKAVVAARPPFSGRTT